MFAIDDGLWSGNFTAADWLFLIAAVVFAVAAVLPHARTQRVDGVKTARVDFAVSLVPLGLCLLSIAWLVA